MTEQQNLPPIQHPLTLLMKARSPECWAELRRTVEHIQSLPDEKNTFIAALNAIGTVHFARFAFLDDSRQLAVITTYDGDFEEYINEFVNKIGHIFDKLLEYIENAPPLPVEKYRAEFLDYIRSHDLGAVGSFYSAYPRRTVFDIISMDVAGMPS